MSSDKKKAKRRKDEYTGPNGHEEPANPAPPKDEVRVAKWMKKHIPTKKTKFLSHNVEYFTASKALDALLTTSFAQGDNALFRTRDEAIQYLDSMLVHKFFHRAKKVPVSEAELRRGKKPQREQVESAAPAPAPADERKDGEVRKRTPRADGDATDPNRSPNAPGSPQSDADGAGGKQEKKKRKIRLDMHPDQQFVDGPEAYIWIYDPIPMHYWLFGALLVIGAIVLCLFPLWPPTLRLGVYYLSIASAGFLVFIIGLAVLRFILFCLVWVATASKLHFWLFPHLTDDVGFFASFWPIYQHTWVGSAEAEAVGKKSKSGRRARKDKQSDGEDEAPVGQTTPAVSKVETAAVEDDDQTGQNSRSDSESECSQKSSTGKDFEMVNSDEVELSS